MNKTFFLCALATVLFSSPLFAITSSATDDYSQNWKTVYTDDSYASIGSYGHLYGKRIYYSDLQGCNKVRVRLKIPEFTLSRYYIYAWRWSVLLSRTLPSEILWIEATKSGQEICSSEMSLEPRRGSYIELYSVLSYYYGPYPKISLECTE